MTTKRKAEPARMTVAELLKTSGVPLSVWMWLERYADGDQYALEPHGTGDDPGVAQTARLVYDVLESKHAGSGIGLSERKFPEEAQDFVEEWLYTLCNYYRVHAWSDPDLAVAALPMLLPAEGSPMRPEGDSTFVLLRSGVERLTTRRERRAFLRDADEGDAEPEPEGATNWRSAFKLSRVLADPRTPAATLAALVEAVNEFANSSQVSVHDAALVRRAFLLMCEARPKGRVRECKAARRALLALLEAIPDEEGGES